MLYSIQFLHQITTEWRDTSASEVLYSIQFLHQITTPQPKACTCRRLYSIQFLHQITTFNNPDNPVKSCIVSNFYIKSQPKTTYKGVELRCIVSNFYIKSQLRNVVR